MGQIHKLFCFLCAGFLRKYLNVGRCIQEYFLHSEFLIFTISSESDDILLRIFAVLSLSAFSRLMFSLFAISFRSFANILPSTFSMLTLGRSIRGIYYRPL